MWLPGLKRRKVIASPPSGPPLTNLAMWLRSDTNLYTDGDVTAQVDGTTVKTWSDYRNVGFADTTYPRVTQATFAVRPIWKSGILNGLPGVQWFGASNTSMGGTLTSTQPYTWGMIAQTIGTGGAYFFDGATANEGVCTNNSSTTTVNMYAGALITASGLVSDGWRQIVARFNGGSSELRINGASSATGNVGATNTTGVTIGNSAGGGGLPINGYIVEVLNYSADLSGSDVTALESYLQSRYGIY